MRLILFPRPAAVAALSLFAITLAGCENMNRQTRACTVDSKEHVAVGPSEDRHSEYRILCTDGLVVRNTDSIVFGERWKQDSATLQARIRVGKTYEFDTIGYRIPFFSSFPNVYAYRERPALAEPTTDSIRVIE